MDKKKEQFKAEANLLGRTPFRNGKVAYHLVDVNKHLLSKIAKIYVSSSWTGFINKSLCTLSTMIKSVIQKNVGMEVLLYMAVHAVAFGWDLHCTGTI